MFLKSLPMRGAWIEIYNTITISICTTSLPMRGAWIEIMYHYYIQHQLLSLPMRGAWIEIFGIMFVVMITGSLPMRGAWIEIPLTMTNPFATHRRSPCGERGLKLVKDGHLLPVIVVAPHAGSVD